MRNSSWVPPQFSVEHGTHQGSIFLFHNPEFSRIEHFHIVLNRNPIDKKYVYLVHATKNKDDALKRIRRFGYSEEYLIECQPGECDALKQLCYIDCNAPEGWPLSKLITHAKKGNFAVVSSCPPPLLERLKGAVHSSLDAPERLKRWL